MVKKLRNWRVSRNITTPNYGNLCKNFLEEMLEPLYSKKEIPHLVDCIYDTYFAGKIPTSENAVVDAINDICVFGINDLDMMGYDFDKTMDETIKEISSRKQNPNQKEVWDKWGADGKWQKDKKQDSSTLYFANYGSCRIV